MKKICAILLAATMLLLCLAGCGNQTVHYTDKENFEMKLYPENGSEVASGMNAIQIVMNTPNVESGHGEIQIYRASDDKCISSYDVRLDEDDIFFNSGKNPAFAQIIVFLSEGEAFESGESYYVMLDDEAFYIDDIKGFNGGIKKGDWSFTVADYGYDGNISEMPTTYLIGNEIEIPVKLAGKAAQAVLLFDNVSVVSADLRELEQDGTFKLKALNAGTATLSVMFLDENGMYIETLAFNITVK